MKTLIATTLAGLSLLALTSASYGQGQVAFQNSTATTPVVYGPGTTNTQGSFVYGPAGTYTYGLYVGASTDTSLSQLTLVDTTASPSAPSSTFFTAGAFNGGTFTGGTGDVAAGQSFSFVGGTQYAVEVVGWTGADGATLAAALASNNPNLLVGYTGIGLITPSSSPSPVAQLFGTGNTFTSGLAMTPIVPEPTTIALGGLGAAALLLFRRKK